MRGSHATQPFILLCSDDSDELVTVFCKAEWQLCPARGLAAEVVCSAAAAAVGLVCPEVVYVDVEEEFLNSIRGAHPRLSGRIAAAAKPLLGSVDLGSRFSDCDADASCSVAKLGEVWAFDRLLLNIDRRREKPNCLTNGQDIALIDHEKALDCALRGSALFRDPWEAGSVRDMEKANPHLFSHRLVGRDVDLSRLQEAWANLTIAKIDEVFHLIPESWLVGEDAIGRMREYMTALGANIDVAFAELKEALT